MRKYASLFFTFSMVIYSAGVVFFAFTLPDATLIDKIESVIMFLTCLSVFIIHKP